jgi:hypothetical protein
MYHVVTQMNEPPGRRGGRDRESRDLAKDDARVESATHGSSPGPTPNGDRDEKKERVLHTRVPAVLELELKRFAENLRIPVSNLVRTILEDALEVADAASENVEGRLKSAAKQLEKERARIKSKVLIDPLREVFAFQEITLAQPGQCAKCRTNLNAGARAHMGLTDTPPGKGRPKIFVCDSCLPA